MSATDRRRLVGRVAEVWRYPVKSMQGEALGRAAVGPGGLDGDRRFAVVDPETGRVASAKAPKKWGGLLGFRAALRDGVLVVTTPDGTEFRDDLGAVVARVLGRPAELRETPPPAAHIEIDWPDVAGLPGAGTATVEGLAAGGFFDLAPLHLLTTATLRRLREHAPGTDFDVRRFRPNLVIDTAAGVDGFAEAAWAGRELAVGGVRLGVTAPCSRCVMTTLPQPGLPGDPRTLRAAVAHNGASVGAYAAARSAGEVEAGAPVWLL